MARWCASPHSPGGRTAATERAEVFTVGLAAALPRDRFDYVWVIGFAPTALPRYAGLTSVFADDATILYRIER